MGPLALTRPLYRQQSRQPEKCHRAQQATLEIRVGYLTLLYIILHCRSWALKPDIIALQEDTMALRDQTALPGGGWIACK